MQAKLNDLALKFKTDKASDGHNYCPIYENYIGAFKNHEFVLWEIGVGGYHFPDRGGESLRMWREYFPKARIGALDLHEKKLSIPGVDIYKGSQADVSSFYKMHDKTGRPNVVIDDASHRCDLTIQTFELVFPLLAPGALYFVEDVHTSYWHEYKGHPDPRPGNSGSEREDIVTTMDFFLQLTHQLNSYTLKEEFRDGRYSDHISFIHFYPELIIIKKK